MHGWRKRDPDECDSRAARVMRGPLRTHMLAQWVSAGTGPDVCEVTLYEDGTVQIEGGAPVEFLTVVQAEWHNHLKGKIA